MWLTLLQYRHFCMEPLRETGKISISQVLLGRYYVHVLNPSLIPKPSLMYTYLIVAAFHIYSTEVSSYSLENFLL